MFERVDSLSSLRALVAAADLRSFRAAGHFLGISASAVGKAIARLEADLSVTLFNRTTRTISLTEAGEVLVARSRRMLDELVAGEMELAELAGRPQGRLRVGLPVSGRLFAKALAAFTAEHPLVDLELDYADRPVDVVAEGFDVVIRVGKLNDSALVQRKLGTFTLKVVASPGYIAKHGTPVHPADLKGHVCLRQRYPSGQLVPWSFALSPQVTIPASLVSNIVNPIVDLVRSGAGISVLPSFMCEEGLMDGSLVSLLDGQLDQTGNITMLWPAGRFRVPKVRAFVECVSRETKLE